MKYTQFDLAQPVKKIDGTEAKMLNVDQTDVVTYTVKDAIRRALDGSYPDEMPGQGNPGLPFEERMKRYELIKKVWNCTEDLELDLDELALINKCIKKFFLEPEVIGFLNEILKK